MGVATDPAGWLRPHMGGTSLPRVTGTRRITIVLAALAALVIALGFVRGRRELARTRAAATEHGGGASRIRVGLVFDIGGRGDKSFNDAAYLGLERARKELGVETE